MKGLVIWHICTEVWNMTSLRWMIKFRIQSTRIVELLKIAKDCLEHPRRSFAIFNDFLTNCPFSHQSKK